MPLGFGGPHAAYMSTREEFARKMPGRIVGVSRDAQGNNAFRLAIQTREQHIKRERATSNICTAQVLLAIMAGMYAVYHGPDGLRRIAQRVHGFTTALANGLRKAGHDVGDEPVFDTLRVRLSGGDADEVVNAARNERLNLRHYDDGSIGVTLDELTDRAEVERLLKIFGDKGDVVVDQLLDDGDLEYPESLARQTGYLTHPVFNTHHSETEMLRYISTLQSRDLSLANSMIPLGSCTMK